MHSSLCIPKRQNWLLFTCWQLLCHLKLLLVQVKLVQDALQATISVNETDMLRRCRSKVSLDFKFANIWHFSSNMLRHAVSVLFLSILVAVVSIIESFEVAASLSSSVVLWRAHLEATALNMLTHPWMILLGDEALETILMTIHTNKRSF